MPKYMYRYGNITTMLLGDRTISKYFQEMKVLSEDNIESPIIEKKL